MHSGAGLTSICRTKAKFIVCEDGLIKKSPHKDLVDLRPLKGTIELTITF